MSIKILRRIFILISLSIIMMLQSCYAPQLTTAEVLFPAWDKNLQNLDSVTLVNRSYLPEEKREQSGLHYKNSRYIKESGYPDSAISDNSLYAFAHNLNIAPAGNTVKNDSIIRIKSRSDFLKAMDIQTINQVCEQMGAKTIVALEAFQSFDSMYRYISDGYFISERKTNLLTAWRVYQYGKPTPVYQTYIEDSVYFNSYGYSKYSADKDLISYKNALYEISYQSGNKFLNKITPHWQDIERIYFDYYSKDMSPANKYARKKLWKKAAAVWKPIADKRRGTKAAYASYNMAIASELSGQLDLAKYWITRALEIRPDNYYFKAYRQTIRERIKRQRKIDQQLEHLHVNN